MTTRRDPTLRPRFDAAMQDRPFRDWLAEYYAGMYEQVTTEGIGAVVALYAAFRAGRAHEQRDRDAAVG